QRRGEEQQQCPAGPSPQVQEHEDRHRQEAQVAQDVGNGPRVGRHGQHRSESILYCTCNGRPPRVPGNEGEKEKRSMIRSQLLAVAVASTVFLACGAAPDGGGGSPDGGATLDVHGRVVGPTGVALAGLSVGIGEKTAVTDMDGRFSITGVVPPYDLNVVLAGTPVSVGRYEGLTRPDPTITFLLLFGTVVPNTATIAGTVSGGEPIGSQGLFTTAFFTTSEAHSDFTAIGITSRNNPFTLPVSWFGPEAISGTVHVLQFEAPGPGESPTAYTGYGTHSALAVTRDGELTGADVALTAPGNATIDEIGRA